MKISIDINADLKNVFDIITIQENMKEWIFGFESREKFNTNVGTKFTQTVKEPDFSIEKSEGEVLVCQSPKIYSEKIENNLSIFVYNYNLSRIDNGTKLDLEYKVTFKHWFSKLIGPYSLWYSRRFLKGQLKRLKRVAEDDDR